eukprot:GHVN01015167.1.p2 GENE.GHVN01015167.1~~GHVN01015167.1.p2  ORF type:complete len:113 (-),score=16.70 GHVN01015167.1:117-455(-)
MPLRFHPWLPHTAAVSHRLQLPHLPRPPALSQPAAVLERLRRSVRRPATYLAPQPAGVHRGDVSPLTWFVAEAFDECRLCITKTLAVGSVLGKEPRKLSEVTQVTEMSERGE